jgi:hypothetical protein
MNGPKLYREQIDDLGIEDFEIDVSSIEAAMSTLNKLADMEDILKKIKYNLHIDIRKIRMDYLKKFRELDEYSKKPGRLRRKTPSEKRTEKKKSLIKKRDLEIKSYEIIEKTINYYLKQIKDSRAYIRNSIQNKVE